MQLRAPHAGLAVACLTLAQPALAFAQAEWSGIDPILRDEIVAPALRREAVMPRAIADTTVRE